jgi:ubiquinone/menaquinone biosynthesis C-methylase UbiE
VERKIPPPPDEIGREHRDEFQPGFHDRLARNWPEPRDQLHAGGWAATRWLVGALGIEPGDAVLDVCCGEGGTAVWLARSLGVRVIGVDLLSAAVTAARARARREQMQERCAFVCANIFSLPFRDASFDIVLGQDPDGFAHARRAVAFQQCARVLRPGGRFGMQHWIPGIGAPRAVIEPFDQANIAVGYPSHGEVHADAYLHAMRVAAFEEIRAVDQSALYRRHMAAISDRAGQRGEPIDPWTAAWRELSRQHPFGVALFGRRPA